jgi:hypothetical protein
VAVRVFRILRWLRRPHGLFVRSALAGLGWIAVAITTRRVALAQEVASLFAQGHFVTGAHRINWYLHHTWTAALTGSSMPLFDPTTDMPARTFTVLKDWLTPRTGLRCRLALLYVQARQIIAAADVDTQKAAITGFIADASLLVRDMRPSDPNAPALPTGLAPVFTLEQARTAMISLQEIATPWYVISGTFLGAVREGTFLAHDYDIDIGVHAADFDDDAFRAQIKASPDLVLVNTSAHLDLTCGTGRMWIGTPLPALYRVLHASGIGIDVFVHHLDGAVRWHGSLKHRWDNHDFGLADYTIAGLVVKGPADANRYLTENYGDWRTPVTRFNCSTGTPNVRFPHNPAAVVEYLRIALSPTPSRDAQIAQLILWQKGYLTRQNEADTKVVFAPRAVLQLPGRDCPAPLNTAR